MRAAESPFESYKSKRILSFASLICFRTQSQSAKKRVCNLPYSISVKSYRQSFRNSILKNMEWFGKKKTLRQKRNMEIKNSQNRFCFLSVFILFCFVFLFLFVRLAIDKSNGKRTNSLWLEACKKDPKYVLTFKGRQQFANSFYFTAKFLIASFVIFNFDIGGLRMYLNQTRYIAWTRDTSIRYSP